MEEKNENNQGGIGFLITADYDPQVQEIAIKLLEHIIEKKTIISYSDLTKKLSFEMNPRNIERPLGVISFECKNNGLPLLSVMVVNKETLMPGDGFCKAYYPELKTEDEQWKKVLEMTEQVLKYKFWTDVLIAFKNWKR